MSWVNYGYFIKKYYNGKKRRWYVRPVNCKRRKFGEYHSLVKELNLYDKDNYFRYFRMNSTIFNDLLQRIKPFIKHKNNHRYPIGPKERLAVTLRLLATGDSQTTSIIISIKNFNRRFYILRNFTCHLKCVATDLFKSPKSRRVDYCF